MAELTSEIRVVHLFATFAKMRRPMKLSEIAAEMEIPVSSCFALIRRLVAEGHLFEPGARRTYYPTGKMRALTEVIAAHDPIVQRVELELTRLRDRSGETVTFGRMMGMTVTYVAAVESSNPLRTAGRIGAVRPAHAVSIGKALLSELPAAERADLLKGHVFTRITPRTPASAAELERDIQQGRKLGYFITREESLPGAMAVGAPVNVGGQLYGLQVAGPIARVEANLPTIVTAIKDAVAALSA